MKLEKIDTSYWLTKDNEWNEKRNEEWIKIEKMIKRNRKKTDINAIKKYYLTGKTPNWKTNKNRDRFSRSLDVMIFW